MAFQQRSARTVRRQTLSDFGGQAAAVKASLSGTAAALHALPGAAALSNVSRQRRLLVFLVINLAFMVVEFVYGYLNHSLGMLSDAAHMLLDNAAVIIGLAAEQHAAKCARGESGHDPMRVRMLAGFANAVILMFVALNIVLEAGVHIMGAGHDVTTHRLLPISIVGLAVNLVGLLFVHEAHNHHQHVHGQHCGSCAGGSDPNMRAIFLHIMADTLGSLAVIISTLAVQTLHWHWADPVASVAIAALIVAAVWPLLQQSAAQLLERSPAPQHYSPLPFTLEEPVEQVRRSLENPAGFEQPKSAPGVQHSAHKSRTAAQRKAGSPHDEAEVIRKSARKRGGQPGWLSDMVA